MNEDMQEFEENQKRLQAVLQKCLEHKEVYELQSKIFYSFYSELMRAGFSEDQALQIVLKHNILPF